MDRWLYLVPFFSYLTLKRLNDIVTLKYRLEVT